MHQFRWTHAQGFGQDFSPAGDALRVMFGFLVALLAFVVVKGQEMKKPTHVDQP